MTNSLRPYYNSDTFVSPIKGHDLNIKVPSSIGSVDKNPTIISRPNQDGNFVYLDLELDNTANVGISLLRLYARTFTTQPVQVCRLLLQVGAWNANRDAKGDKWITEPERSEDDHDDQEKSTREDGSEDEEIDYFTAVTGNYSLQAMKPAWSPTEEAAKKARRKLRKRKSSSKSHSSYSEIIHPASNQLVDIISALNEKDSFKGLWRGLNSTFLVDALNLTIESWLSGFISSISGIPDPLFVEMVRSPSPFVSLGTTVVATILTSIIVSPIDVIRTRLTVTTFSTQPRSNRQLIYQLDSYLSPLSVLIPTVFYSGLPAFVRHSTPYFLYVKLGIDRYGSPFLYSMMTLVSSLVELVVKLPLETMMRRAQVASQKLKPESLIIVPAAYDGMISTMWDVMSGNNGIDMLYRGWRISVVSALGSWGVNALQKSEPEQERF